MTQEVTLPRQYIADLYENYQTMAEACLAVAVAVSDDKGEYPVYMPKHGSREADKFAVSARKVAIESMTQYFVMGEGESITDAGILCASGSTVEVIEHLNSGKENFKQAIMDIREFGKSKEVPVTRITQLIRDEVVDKGYRTKELKKALGTVGIKSLNLRRCYAKIRILPPGLEVFSWTWATGHSRIKKVTREEALALVDHLPHTKREAAETARALLAKCSPGDTFARKTFLENQLRANYSYRENGVKHQRSCTISGVIIAQQDYLPRYVWRDNPANLEVKPPKLERVSGIEPKPFIQVLGLHHYAR